MLFSQRYFRAIENNMLVVDIADAARRKPVLCAVESSVNQFSDGSAILNARRLYNECVGCKTF